MADINPDAVMSEDKPKQNGAVRMSLPEVLCTPDPSDSSKTVKTLISSESKLSLPFNLGTPTSPLKLSSPISLPTSPSPFQKNCLTDVRSSPKRSQLLAPATTKDDCLPLNSGSATGNPRNKCALQPGHSLMDWIRLGNSGKDLTGVGGRMRAVSAKELATHNTPDNAWLAIRGRVYNITHYLPYHPGGKYLLNKVVCVFSPFDTSLPEYGLSRSLESGQTGWQGQDELMRGAGIDATKLFDNVHPWVNYDSLLSKCLIGPLRTAELPDAEELFGPSNPSPKSDRLREPSKAQELVRKSMENLANCITPVRKKIAAKSEENVKAMNPSKIMQSLIQSSDLPVTISRRAGSDLSSSSNTVPAPLRFDWIQTSKKLTLFVYTSALSNPAVSARVVNEELLIKVITNNYIQTLKLVPEHSLQKQIQLKIYSESGKIEVCVYKKEDSIWHHCGETVITEASPVPSPQPTECVVQRRGQVSHDTVLLAIVPQDEVLVVPLGHHIRVHYNKEGAEQIRSYTPVGEGWCERPSFQDCTSIRLAVKGYPSGVVSTHLTGLGDGDRLTISGPYGNFYLKKLKNIRIVNLIAAGTGITPLLGILRFMLGRSNPRCEKVNLLFFNKKEEDILFRSNFEEIVKEDSRFSVTHVLSEATVSWSGRVGRVTATHLTDVLGDSTQCTTELCTKFACVCGPTEFTQTTLQFLTKIGMKDDCIHPFMG